MKTIALLVGSFLLVFCFLGTTGAQSLSIRGTLHRSTDVLFSGTTDITATFTGFPMSTIVDSPLIKGMNTFILLGDNTIKSLDTVIVVEDVDITQVDSLEELFLRYADHLLQFSDVTVTTETGFFLLGYPAGGTINIHTVIPYAVSSSHDLILNRSPIPCAFLATQTPLVLSFSGDYSVLADLSSSAVIRLTTQNGKTLWSGNGTNTYLYLQDQHFQISQQPPLTVLPLNPDAPLTYTVAPADQTSIHLPELLASVSAKAAQLSVANISEEMRELQGYEPIISNARFIANGAMMLANSNDTITIDGAKQRVEGFGLFRVSDLTVTCNASGNGPGIMGASSLAFLGDHFYNPQAGTSDSGIAFPYLLLVIWVVALAVFLYVWFILKPVVDANRDATMKKYALYVHVILLIAAFLVLDWEVNAQLGISAITSLMAQGSMTFTGLILGLELLLWVLGYFLLVLPVRLLLLSGLRFFHVGKGGRGLGAGVADLMIGVFAAFYLLLFLNILLSALQLQNLFTSG